MSENSQAVGAPVEPSVRHQRSLKVWGGLIHMGRREKARAVVAATSQAKAAEALHITVSELRGWWAVSGNKDDCGAALSQPGRVFMATSSLGKDFRPVVRIGGAWVDA